MTRPDREPRGHHATSTAPLPGTAALTSTAPLTGADPLAGTEPWRPPKRQNISSGSPFEGPIGFSRAVRVGNRVVVAGTAPVWPDGSVDSDPERQAERCLEIMLAALHEAGATAADVIRTRAYLTAASDWEAVGRAHGRAFREVRPASTMVVVAGLLDARWKVEMEAEAVIAPGGPVEPNEVS